MPDFDAAMDAYLAEICEAYRNWYDANGYHEPMTPPDISYTVGRVNVKVIARETFGAGEYVHSFVRRDTGDILKPACWKAPAKGVRGSIYSNSNGAEALGLGGRVRYLT